MLFFHRQLCIPNSNLIRIHEDLTFALDNMANTAMLDLWTTFGIGSQIFAGLPCK